MKKLMVLGLLLAAAPALAQSSITLPPDTVLGRTGITPGPAQAIPFATLQSLLGLGSIAPTVNNGTIAGGTFTPVCGINFLQYFINGGAFTMAAPVADGSCDLLQINSGSAGTVTFTGFTFGSNTGDVLDTINGHKFIIHIETINTTTTALIKALQ